MGSSTLGGGDAVRLMAKRMKGHPKTMWSEALMNAPTTAHILGGCVMAESPEKGVVNFSGEIYCYPNLYVADGSVVPANLAVNPSLTITALSEYIMSQVTSKAS